MHGDIIIMKRYINTTIISTICTFTIITTTNTIIITYITTIVIGLELD